MGMAVVAVFRRVVMRVIAVPMRAVMAQDIMSRGGIMRRIGRGMVAMLLCVVMRVIPRLRSARSRKILRLGSQGRVGRVGSHIERFFLSLPQLVIFVIG